MKKRIIILCSSLASIFLLNGCVAAIGNRDAQKSNATVGQQLVDLQKAKDAGALSDSEFHAQKTKLLGSK